jgi:alpha-beta hydrolase superfamily lysophospholipase
MKKENFTVTSPFDGIELACLAFLPDTEPKGILQIVHGMCEYKERYEEMMEYYVSHSYVVVAYDQRGHGVTAKSMDDLGWFGDKTAEGIVEDAVSVTRELKKRYPNLPVILFGHSMGSMVVRCYIQKYDTEIDKLIVCGSPSENPLSGTAIMLTKLLGLVKGERHRSKFLSYMATGRGNEKFPGEGSGAWLSHNRENIEAFYGNPYGRFRFTCNGFENLFRLMKNTYVKKRYQVDNPTLPIHFISGSEDAVLMSEEKWLKSHNTLRKVGYENVSGKLYHGLRHEVHNELERATVYADILEFIEK